MKSSDDMELSLVQAESKELHRDLFMIQALDDDKDMMRSMPQRQRKS